jgi:hypothetical protein
MTTATAFTVNSLLNKPTKAMYLKIKTNILKIYVTLLQNNPCWLWMDIIYQLELKLIWIMFNNSVPTTKKTQYFSITKINWSMLFKEIISLFWELYETHKYNVLEKCGATDY